MSRSGNCKEIWCFALIQQGCWENFNHTIFCFGSALYWTEKNLLFTTTSNVLPSKFKCWPQKFCRVKLIPWNLVKSHLYVLLPGNFHFYNKVNAIGQWENHNYLLVFAHTVKHIYSCQKFQVLDILGHQICQEIEKNLNISKL